MPCCMATSATPGRSSSAIMSPIANTSGWPGSVQSGEDARSARRGRTRRRWPRRAAPPAATPGRRRPRSSSGRDPLARPVRLLHVDPGGVDVGDDALSADLDAEPLAARSPPSGRAGRRSSPGSPCRRRRAATRALRGVDPAEVVLAAPERDSSAIWPAISTPVGPPADHDEGEPVARRFVGILLDLGHLEGAEDPAAQLERVVDRLHAGRVARELVVAEVGLPGARRDDQAVVREARGPRRRRAGPSRSGPPGRSR